LESIIIQGFWDYHRLYGKNPKWGETKFRIGHHTPGIQWTNRVIAAEVAAGTMFQQSNRMDGGIP